MAKLSHSSTLTGKLMFNNLRNFGSGHTKCSPYIITDIYIYIYIYYSYEKIKEVSIPTTVYSASMIKDNSIFVCGGDDLKIYKYNYETGTEIGNYASN